MTELLPRSQINIFVQVVEADGGTRCAAVNAATLALADAGIPLRDLATCCAGGYLNRTAILDMNYVEDAAGGADVVVAIHPRNSSVVLFQADNRLSVESLEEVGKLAMLGCKTIAKLMKQVLQKETQRRAIAQGVIGIS
eukprot:TRINITY_DN31252_c0_g1_i1.p2 TRINITY_DN31252_c0_g1~~TRINITY_DN31252_c0_g1_i1.p2  ORF type:complete len:139 (+),score=33.40 TRINITY_DN31252_c0_g1_i1:133-549(+)